MSLTGSTSVRLVVSLTPQAEQRLREMSSANGIAFEDLIAHTAEGALQVAAGGYVLTVNAVPPGHQEVQL